MKLLPLFLLLVFPPVYAQTHITLSGKVTDKATGAALPYAAIRLAGTSIGTTSNQAGDFISGFRLLRPAGWCPFPTWATNRWSLTGQTGISTGLPLPWRQSR